jgi:hypothetical protein
LITTASLKDYSLKELSKLAQRSGVTGWKSMKKDALVKAILRSRKSSPAAKPKVAAKSTSSNKRPVAKNGHATTRKPATKRPLSPAKGRTLAKIQKANAHRERHKDLSQAPSPKRANGKPEKDRIVLMVRDPFWLHVCWTVTRASVIRAEAALAELWHTARPVLRLLEVDAGTTTSSAERVAREIDIHSGVSNWYIDVPNPPRSFRVEIGYRTAGSKFHSLCRSNIVTTPLPGSGDAIDKNWDDVAENYERVYALSGGYNEDTGKGDLQELFEERLRRPMGSALGNRYGAGAEGVLKRHRDFNFQVDAEMILYGTTQTDVRVTVSGEPIKVRADGSFTLRMAMPDKRQVIPIVAASPDGVEQRTVVLAIERNTKVLEPMNKEAASE